MLKEILTNLLLIIIVATLFSGIVKFKYLDSKLRIIFFYIAFSLTSEIASQIVLRYEDTKTPVYHFSCIISLIIVSLYFFQTIFSEKNWKYNIATGVILVLIGFLNLRFQGLHQLCSNTLILRGFLIILMSLYGLYRIFIDEKVLDPVMDPHFWVWVCLLLLFGGTYFFWSYIKMLTVGGKGLYMDIVSHIHIIILIAGYTGVGVIFLLHPKKFH